MPMPRCALLTLALLVACATPTARLAATEQTAKAPAQNAHTRRWNAFADALLRLHEARIAGRDVRREERLGSYAGLPDFYREVSYYDAGGRRLARLQWERAHPERLHAIQVYVHDADGRLLRDYSASYLPIYRNAPIQTLVNLHSVNRGLRGFRQFDASGERLYEHCGGRYFDTPVNLALDSWELPYRPAAADDPLLYEAYLACFETLPVRAGRYLDPLVDAPQPAAAARAADAPSAATRHVAQGDAHFQRGEFAQAVAAYDRALALDARYDAAHFGRGLALGRMGRIDEGVAALSVFIARHPDSSLAHTKRGIRHFWNGHVDLAERDLRRALELDPGNAEASDDLGVILAQRGEHAAAIDRFRSTIRLEPGYLKAHHNLALTLHLQARDAEALGAIDQALALNPAAREALLLKSAILAALGRNGEAHAAAARAAPLPEANWTERAPLK
jgi:tetratricopeptide (TPR) repeat protein